jgi:hypothetical protein
MILRIYIAKSYLEMNLCSWCGLPKFYQIAARAICTAGNCVPIQMRPADLWYVKISDITAQTLRKRSCIVGHIRQQLGCQVRVDIPVLKNPSLRRLLQMNNRNADHRGHPETEIRITRLNGYYLARFVLAVLVCLNSLLQVWGWFNFSFAYTVWHQSFVMHR